MTIYELKERQKEVEAKIDKLEKELAELRKRKTLTFTLFGIPIKTINI